MRIIVSAAIVLAAASPAMAGPAGLVPHRAVYDLTLKKATERSGIDDMFGRMVYEFNGSDCDGYTVSFRFVTQIDNGDDIRMTDQQTTTYEDIRAHTFDFATKSYVDRSLDKEIRGSAVLADGELKVDLDSPREENLQLTPALFPTEHMIELIDKARKGETLYESRIYDGSDDADASLITTTLLGKKQAADGKDIELQKAESLSGTPFWPVAISYFNDDTNNDGLPVYSIAFKLYENGVTRDLTMDYGEFALQGKLTELKYLNPPSCPN